METLLCTLLSVEWTGFARVTREGSVAAQEARLARFTELVGSAHGEEGVELVALPFNEGPELRVLVFPAPSAALRGALTLRGALAEAGFEAVLGLHAGECLRRGGTLLGTPLSVAAEIPGHGRPGDLLLTEVFRLTVPPKVAAEVGSLQRLEGVMALAGEPAVVHRLDAEGRGG